MFLTSEYPNKKLWSVAIVDNQGPVGFLLIFPIATVKSV